MTDMTDSPRWNSTTKMVIGLTLVAIIAALIVRFQNVVPPLILAFILVYLIYPAASALSRRAHLKWGISVGVIYILLILIILGLLTVVGLEIIVQIQSLITLVESNLVELPKLVQDFVSTLPTQIGPFSLDIANLDLNELSRQLISSAQSILGRTGELLGMVAGGAFNIFGWGVFVLLVSFFILSESGGLREEILSINLPGYSYDLKRMGKELGQIWNAFLRGQITLIMIAAFVYTIVLGVLGVRYALGLALLAGLARFIPYAGPAISWTVLALVTFFQPYKPLGMSAFVYMLLILVIAWIIDGILDNVVSPRIMAEALKVHPAAVFVAAIVALELLGVLGVVIAAPMLATMQLVTRYVVRKLFDLDPWAGIQENPTPPSLRVQIENWIWDVSKRFRPHQTK